MKKRLIASLFVWLALVSPSLASWTIANLGTAQASSTSISLSGLTIPSNANVVVVVSSGANCLLGSLTDGTNIFSLISGASGNINGSVTNGTGCIFSFYYASGGSGVTLTFNQGGSTPLAISAISAVGGSSTPVDISVGTFGKATPPSLSSGVPAQSNELFVAYIVGSNTGSFSQDTANGWAAPPNVISASVFEIGGGNQVNAGTGAITWAPGWTASTPYFVGLITLKPATAGGGAIFNRNFMGIGN